MFIINEIGSLALQPLAQAIDGLGDLSTLTGEELEAFGRLLEHASTMLEQARARMRGQSGSEGAESGGGGGTESGASTSGGGA